MRLHPSAIAAGVRLEALAIVGSTNAEAFDRARGGERGPLWITATEQSAGRGRRGRPWTSPPGNLYASLLLSEPAPLACAPELAFVAALALRDAVIAAAPALAPQLSLKWPNDLLLAGRKCAGILIEGEAGLDKSVTVVIGIGVNCAHHPSAARAKTPKARGSLFPATDLRAQGADVTPRQLFMHLSASLVRRIAQWDRGRGFPAIVEGWLAAARGIGEEITVHYDGGERTGRFAGLDQTGRLLLELADGRKETISAGDVFPFALDGGRRISSRRA